jgi:hypothetical protein
MIGAVHWKEDGRPFVATLHDDLSWEVLEDRDREPILASRYHAWPGEPELLRMAMARSWLRQLAMDTGGQVVHVDLTPSLAVAEES